MGEFVDGFGKQIMSMFEDEDIPTDSMLVVKIFDDLINLPAGSRPLRTIVGLDFGFQAVNDAVDPIRKGVLASICLGNCDGPQSKA